MDKSSKLVLGWTVGVFLATFTTIGGFQLAGGETIQNVISVAALPIIFVGTLTILLALVLKVLPPVR